MPAGPKKIVHICKVYLPTHGGIQVVIQRISDGLSRAFSTSVVSCSRDQPGTFRLGNIRLVNAKSFGEWLSLPVAPGVIPRIRQAVRGSDLVCVHYPFPLAELALLFLPLGRRPLIVYWHSEIVAQRYARYLVRPFTHLMLRRADRIVLSSPALLEHSRLLQAYRDRCEVIPFGYSPAASTAPATGDDYYVCVGRHVTYKGIDTLIRAWSGLDCRLKLVGSGPLLNKHKSLANELGLTERIEFVELADDDRVRELLGSARALILPSVAPNEAFGLVQIEAMALGRPVINTRLPSGVPWVARDGEEAITVIPGDSEGLREAVRRLEADPGLRERLGEQALRRWQAVFAVDQFCDRTEQLYQGLLAGSPADASGELDLGARMTADSAPEK